MKVKINKRDILPEGEYELTDINKLQNAKGNFSVPPNDRQILLEYDRIAGRIVKDGVILPPQSLFMIESNRSIEKYSDEELQTVIRRAENTNISGSLYQRANNEWKLRQDQKMFNATKRNKWTSNNLPIGYPMTCSSDQIREVIQDLFDEKHRKLNEGKVNVAWEKIINDHIENGSNELNERREVRHWYEKPPGILFLGVITGVVATVLAGYILFKAGWL